MNPLVSVIIPNYNHAPYLCKRIESILFQTFQDFEIIILDDCSKDNSKDILENYRAHPKVSHIIYNETNSGSTFIQWNKGFNLAKGKYIWIAESDDFCEHKMLEILVRQIENHSDCVLAYCLSQFVNSIGEKIPPIIKTRENMYLSGNKFISTFMVDANVIHNASSAIFKKECISLITSEYTNYKAAGDRLFWIEIAKQGNVAIVNTPLNYFRQHEIKVSPTKLIKGTTFKEDFLIFAYLKKNRYIQKCRGFFVKNHYINNIYKVKEMSNENRNEVLYLWNNKFSSYPQIVSIIEIIYKYTMKIYIKLFI